jgi:SAM-dependent methyltransferase
VSRGRLFDLVAENYDDVRPTYPDRVYDAIDRLTPLHGSRVVDLAAGTGVATRQLISRGADVVAVDPGVPMLHQLRRRSPDVPVVVARAEALPFDESTFDLACCATAWHWVDAGESVAQVRRVVRPGGLLALWWANQQRDDEIAWEQAEAAVHDRWELRGGSRPPTQAGVGPREAAADLRRRGLDVVVETELEWSRRISRETHLKMVGTYSVVLALGEQRHALLADIAEALAPWETVDERLWGTFVVARLP